MTSETDFPNQFSITADFIQHTGQHIFLTGKAGTGKTTFLKHIKEKCGKRMAVIAPTGVAAINAGGVTMHSFFQLPMGCFLPGLFRGSFQSQQQVTDKHHLLRNLRYTAEKTELLRHLELLVIDEVSMLRCDWLDAMDILLRHVRKNQYEAFGGVQVLFIGDLYQLPPVATEQDWLLLRDYYETPFFFSAQVIKQAGPLCIELDKVYRQSDEAFIHLLNRVRNNEVSDEDLQQLHQRYQPGFNPDPKDHFITLTTHNYKADEINSSGLRKLPGKEFTVKATLTGEFPERVFPVEQSLVLKKGAQIMFIKNDVKEKKYFNGKIGVLEGIERDGETECISVHFPESGETIKVQQETWRNIRYIFKEQENKLEEQELGSFTQYPVRLAWAVTIHKSQGLTFQRAVIDAGAAFAAGQVYVALSRCVSLEGLVLRSPIRREVIKTDEAIVAYMMQQPDIQQLKNSLTAEKEIYAVKTLLELFNLQPLSEKISDFIQYMGLRKLEDKEKIIAGLHAVHDAILTMHDVAQRFQAQVKGIAAESLSGNIAEQLQERVAKGKAYFGTAMDEKVISPLENLLISLHQMKKVRKVLLQMDELIGFCSNFALRYRYKESRRAMPAFQRNVTGTEIESSGDEQEGDLMRQLKTCRTALAQTANLPPFRICNDATLKEMVKYLPQTITEMAMIRGMGDFTLHNYGETFLQIVKIFAETNQLKSSIHLKTEEMKKTRKVRAGSLHKTGDLPAKTAANSTQLQSFQLFQSGKSIAEIASLRGLAASTIEAHLAYFVEAGELEVSQLISPEKMERIREALQNAPEPGLSTVRQLLGGEVSYAAIRFVIADMNRAAAVAAGKDSLDGS